MHAKKIHNKIKGIFDKQLFFVSLILTIIGLIAVADASAPLAIQRFSDKLYFFKQQAIWSVVGLLMMIIFSKVRYVFWEKIATPLFFASVLALILVFVPGIGVKVLGARRWIDMGFTTFQPSELIKLSLCIYLAKLYSKDKTVFAYLIPVFITLTLIMLQPDLGTTMVILTFSMAQIFASGVNLMSFFKLGALGLIFGTLMIFTSDYRKERLMTFLKISQNPLDEGYHIRQVLLALGSGGVFGVGLGHSRQKFLFLPETATDSIFAIIAEEVGFIGSSLLILLMGFFVFRAFRIAKKAPDKFSFILATGLSAWIGIQIVFNIGSMVALIPLTGIPLPFISFGGTSLVAVLTASGILQNISKHGNEKK